MPVRYPPHLLDEIRARLPISAVVSRKVRLKKAGREWKGLSPFNAEKTPSFYVNDQKQFYHDFSSSKHGDVFTFLMETEGLSFPEAVERLAAEAGVDLPKASPEAERQVEVRRELTDVLDLAARFFEGKLAAAAGEGARAYLGRRQISPQTQAEFRIGFAPDGRTALLDHLRGKGFGDDLIVRAGLAIAPENGGGLYDRFRGRVMFPIQDWNGRVVAFGGRGLSDQATPKYLNSPETETFQKGQIVFNGHRARPAARKDQALAVVEGYVDAIAVWQAGHKAVVATLGTAFTEEQIKSLWRIDPEPVLCFDGDRAGRDAAFRAVDRMLPYIEVGKTFRFAFLPDGQDPDDLIRASGREAFTSQLAAAQKFWDVLWNRELGAVDTSDPDGIAALNATLRRLVGQIGDTQLRYRYELTTRLSVNELAYRETRRRFRQPAGDVSALSLIRTSRLVAGRATSMTGIERIFLGLSVAFPELAAACHDEITQKITFRGGHKLSDGGVQPYQIFADELFRIIAEEEDELTPEVVHRKINPVFYEVMDEVHGRATEGRSYGHALARHFPAYDYVRDHAYHSRCYWMFLRQLIVREMQDELQHDVVADDLDAADRAFHLSAAIHAEMAYVRAEEGELDQLASDYRPRRKAA